MIGEELRVLLDGYAVEQLDPATDLVTTPFLDKGGNQIRIFVRRRGSQYYLFNEKDKIFSREKRGRFLPHTVKEELREVLRRFDVYHIEGEISTEATAENLPARIRNLTQALIVLDAMF